MHGRMTGNLVRLAFLGLASMATISATQAVPPLESPSPTTTPAQKDVAAILPQILEFAVDDSQRMTVPVSIDGSETYPFVVDTGAERTVIAEDLGRTLQLSAGSELKLATVSGPATVDSFKAKNLSMSSIKVNDLEMPALKRANLGAYGLLGIDSLQNHKVVIDFAKGEMDVVPSKKRSGFSRTTRNVIVVTARRRAGRLVLTNARIGNIKVDVVIDTGAQATMGNAALRKRLRRSQRRIDYIPVGLTSVTGRRMLGDFTQIKDITIGGLTITDLPMTFTGNYAFRALELNRKPAMLLGMDALKLFETIEIDFAKKRVTFQLKRNSQRQSPGRLAWKESRTTAMSFPSPVIFSP